MDEIIEAAARALAGHMRAYLVNEPLPYDEWTEFSKEEYRKLARAAIAAIMPAIGERMAQLADAFEHEENGRAYDKRQAGRDDNFNCARASAACRFAADIRTLANTMAAEVGKQPQDLMTGCAPSFPCPVCESPHMSLWNQNNGGMEEDGESCRSCAYEKIVRRPYRQH